MKKITSQKWQKNLLFGALILVIGLNLLMLPEVFGVEIIDRYLKGILILALINIILAVSLNLINGGAGMLSIGHAGFMAVGAYASSLLSLYFDQIQLFPSSAGILLRFPIALLFGGLLAALIGFLIGIPVLRLRGDYLAIATLGFGEIIRVIALNLEITHGARGLPGIPNYTNFWWAQLFAILTVVVIWNIVHSNHGRALVSIREDEIAAAAMGINTTYYKVAAFVIGAFFAGVAGGLFAHHLAYIDPKSFGFMKTVEILLMVVLGGLGSITGSIIAAVVLTGLPEALRFLQSYRMIIYAATLILLMIYRPQGLLGRREAKIGLISERIAGRKTDRLGKER